MLGNGLPGTVEMRRYGIGRHGLQSQQAQDSPAGRVGDGLKNVSAHGLGNQALINVYFSTTMPHSKALASSS